MSTVLVFKTSVQNTTHVHQLQKGLDRLINKNGRWNFDLEDCDNIFRVETKRPNPTAITRLFYTRGFRCEELT